MSINQANQDSWKHLVKNRMQVQEIVCDLILTNQTKYLTQLLQVKGYIAPHVSIKMSEIFSTTATIFQTHVARDVSGH